MSITLNQNELSALREVLDYLRHDEQKDYESHYEDDENKDSHIYRKIQTLDNCLKHHEKTFAQTSWCADDVLECAETNGLNLIEEQAENFLAEYADQITDAMVEAGWTVIEDKLNER